MANKKALIFGITGQDGYYLSKLLFENNYDVYGGVRRVSIPRVPALNYEIVDVDITDSTAVSRVIKALKPDEIYNLAAQSHVAISFNEPSHTWEVTAKGCLNILEAIRNESPASKFYQASSSEMFGGNSSCLVGTDFYQDENTPFEPKSPYAIAKLAAHHMTQVYRKAYKIFACSGIMFNHESERRGENFVTRKITKYVAKLSYHKIIPRDYPKLKLGNINIQRDWGHAEDYVRGMYMMLQHDIPDDYVLATGVTHSLEDFLFEAFKCTNLNWRDFVEIDPSFYRPSEVPYCRGEPTKAKKVLGWETTVSFEKLVERMVTYDRARETFDCYES